MPRLNVTIPTSVGNLEIYANPSRLNKAEKLIKDTPKILTEAYLEAATAEATMIANMAKRCIRDGIPPRGSGVSWPGHANSTIRKYGEHGLLNLTGQYLNMIKVIRIGSRVAAGVPPGQKKYRPDHRQTKLTLTQVAKVLEYGSEGTIPARPLWRYLWPAIGGSEHYKKRLVEVLRKKIRKYM